MIRSHPKVVLISALGCLLAALGVFLFRGQMATEGIGGNDGFSYMIGFAFDFIEVGMIAFIVSPIAPKVQGLLSQWGFAAPRKQIERVIDSVAIVSLLFVYGFDLYATVTGCLHHGFSPTMSWLLAIFQLPLFELLANIGFWLMEDYKLTSRALDGSVGSILRETSEE